jgi:hypothetical protein
MTASSSVALRKPGGSPCASIRAIRKALTLSAVTTLVGIAAPRAANAEVYDTKWKLTPDRADFFMYGRMGSGWTKSGQVIAGRYMNLGDRKAIGGRLEEGDYLEPGVRYLRFKDEERTPWPSRGRGMVRGRRHPLRSRERALDSSRSFLCKPA